jgi:hypothetical protein
VKREAEENFGALTFSGSVPPVRAAVKLNNVALSLRAVGGLEQVRLCVFSLFHHFQSFRQRHSTFLAFVDRSAPNLGTSLIKIIRLPQVGQFDLLAF